MAEGVGSSDLRPVPLLGGSYAPLAERLTHVGRAVIVIGEAQELIVRALSALERPVMRAQNMIEAVEIAANVAHEGDLVLLAPACSSYDMYRSYAHRGDDFAECVRRLGGVS